MVASGGYCPLVACWLLVGTRSIDDSNRELVVRRIKSRLDLDLDIGRGGEGEEREGMNQEKKWGRNSRRRKGKGIRIIGVLGVREGFLQIITRIVVH